MSRKVVVTGLGAVTPLGNTVEETWQAVREGKSGIGKITAFDTSDYECKIAGEVKGFEASRWIDRKEARKMGRYTQFAVAAAVQAMADAGLNKDNMDVNRAGVLLGNGIGGFEVIESSIKKYFDAGNARIPPLSIPMLIPNEAPGNISMLLGLHGTALSLATACSSGTDALGLALDQIRHGRLDICLAGGTEATITGYGIGCPRLVVYLLPERLEVSEVGDVVDEAVVLDELLQVVLDGLSVVVPVSHSAVPPSCPGTLCSGQ